MDIDNHECPICNKVFKNRGAMRKHKSVIHRLTPKKACSICAKDVSINNLNAHYHLCSKKKCQELDLSSSDDDLEFEPSSSDDDVELEVLSSDNDDSAHIDTTESREDAQAKMKRRAAADEEFLIHQKQYRLKSCSIPLSRLNVYNQADEMQKGKKAAADKEFISHQKQYRLKQCSIPLSRLNVDNLAEEIERAKR